MPLIPDTFKTGLESIFDQESENFDGFPESFSSAAERWATAFHNYAKEVVPPSTTSIQAKEAFKSMFLTMGYNGRIIFPKCFVAYVNALAPGMQPAFSSTPPIGEPQLEPIYAVGLGGGSSAQCISMLVSIVDAWMRTGIAVNNSSGVTTNWN